MAELTADVQAEVDVLPAELDFGIIDAGAIAERTIRISKRMGKGARITGVDSSLHLVDVQYSAGPIPDEGGVLLVTLKQDGVDTSRPLRDALTIKLADSRIEFIELPIRATIKLPVSITPSTVIIGADEVGLV
jgi:hypothetical protein